MSVSDIRWPPSHSAVRLRRPCVYHRASGIFVGTCCAVLRRMPSQTPTFTFESNDEAQSGTGPVLLGLLCYGYPGPSVRPSVRWVGTARLLAADGGRGVDSTTRRHRVAHCAVLTVRVGRTGPGIRRRRPRRRAESVPAESHAGGWVDSHVSHVPSSPIPMSPKRGPGVCRGRMGLGPLVPPRVPAPCTAIRNARVSTCVSPRRSPVRRWDAVGLALSPSSDNAVLDVMVAQEIFHLPSTSSAVSFAAAVRAAAL